MSSNLSFKGNVQRSFMVKAFLLNAVFQYNTLLFFFFFWIKSNNYVNNYRFFVISLCGWKALPSLSFCKNWCVATKHYWLQKPIYGHWRPKSVLKWINNQMHQPLISFILRATKGEKLCPEHWPNLTMMKECRCIFKPNYLTDFFF